MKTVNFVYLSITGNTKGLCDVCARQLKSLHGYNVIYTDVSQFVHDVGAGLKPIVQAADAYCFAAYTDYYQLPEMFLDFFKAFDMSILTNKIVFSLATNAGDSGVLLDQFAQIFAKFNYIGGFATYFCCNCPGWQYPEAEDQIYAVNNAFEGELAQLSKKVDSAVQQGKFTVVRNTPQQDKAVTSRKLYSREYHMGNPGNGPYIILTDKCVGCGKCANACPANVIKIVNGKAVFQDVKNCYWCLKCLQHCEHHAITNKSRTFDNLVQYHFHDYQLCNKNGCQSKKQLQAEYQAAMK